MKQKFTMPDGEVIEKDFPQWKTPYNHDTNFESDRTAQFNTEPSLTKQEFREEVNINTIINRVLKTGEPPPISLPEHFTDLTGRTDYFTMASQVAKANALFYELDADTRSTFLNDPTRWADAVVKATEQGDLDALEALNIDVADARKAERDRSQAESDRKALAADQPSPTGGGTPAHTGAAKPPEAPAKAGTPAGGKPPAN